MDETQKGFFEHGKLQVIDDGFSSLLGVDQIGLFQHREMRRHGRLGDGELVADLASGQRTLTKQLKHASAGRIGKGFEDLAHDAIIS